MLKKSLLSLVIVAAVGFGTINLSRPNTAYATPLFCSCGIFECNLPIHCHPM